MESIQSIEDYLSNNLDQNIHINVQSLCGLFSNRKLGQNLFGEDPVFKTSIVITKERANFIKEIIKQLILAIKKDRYQSEHLLTGVVGIGKSYTLLLLAHCLSFNTVKAQNIHVVMIAECGLLQKKRWKYVMNQFQIAFENDKHILEDIFEKSNSIEKLLDNFIAKKTKNNEIIILIVDQINWAFQDGDKILRDLLTFEWTMIIVSESANNEIPEKKIYQSFYHHIINNFVNESSLQMILENELTHLPNLEEMKRIFEKTKGIPREAILLCLSPGNSFVDKIKNYEKERKIQIRIIHHKFLDGLKEYEKPILLKAIFFMDKEVFVEFKEPPPIIDKQLMIYEKGLDLTFKISAIMPIVNEVLKYDFEKYGERLILSIDKNYYFKTRKDLLQFLVSPTTDPRIRGILFEDFIVLKFKQMFAEQKKVCLLIQSVIYIKNIFKHSKTQMISYDVSFNFNKKTKFCFLEIKVYSSQFPFG